jgi:hypothetical protein
MWVFENRALRIFGSKRDKMIGGQRKLHNTEQNNLYVSLNTVRMIKSMRMRWTGHYSMYGEKRNAYRILVGKPGRK